MRSEPSLEEDHGFPPRSHRTLRACLSALLEIEPDESIEFVTRFLDHRDEQVAEAAAIALGDSRLDQAFTVLRARWEAAVVKGPRERTLLRAAAHHRSEMAIDWLLSVVVEGDSAHARFAAMLLALNRSNARLMARLRAAVAERGQQELETLVDLVLKDGEG